MAVHQREHSDDGAECSKFYFQRLTFTLLNLSFSEKISVFLELYIILSTFVVINIL